MATVSLNSQKSKDLSVLKKMFIQILISLSIYFGIYIIKNNNYIFSEDFLNKTNEILSYDINFYELCENIKINFSNINDKLQNIKNNKENAESSQDTEETQDLQENENQESSESTSDLPDEQNEQSNQNEQSQESGAVEVNSEQNNEANIEESNLTEEEIEIKKIKEISSFVKPVEGVVSSKFGEREPTTSTVPKNHTGVDIVANSGTPIVSSTSGEVVLASDKGDYGKHLKIQLGDIAMIYAHCSKLLVNQGEKVEQGQVIAEVGSTGNSTGPHLHFEIRILEKPIDPQKILEI